MDKKEKAMFWIQHEYLIGKLSFYRDGKWEKGSIPFVKVQL